MRLAHRVGETIMVDVEHLNYGKLVARHNEGLAASEGLGVTRRSKGLNAAHVADLRLSALLDVQPFDPSMIDRDMARSGILLVRTLPRTAPHFAGRTVLVRARFRPENGEGAPGRLHQQAAIWLIWKDEWSGYAQDVLRKAANELIAEPDKMDESPSARFDVAPKPVELRSEALPGDLSSEPVRHILNILLPQASLIGEDDSVRSITFGKGDFPHGEKQFLQAVGTALDALPRNFNRWDDICIGSGLRPDCGTLRIKYLPSNSSQLGPAPDQRSIERRLGSTDRPRRARSLTNDIDRPFDAPAAAVHSKIASSDWVMTETTARTADAPAPASSPLEAFAAALSEHRKGRTVETSKRLIEAARAFEFPPATGVHDRYTDERLTHQAVLEALEGPDPSYALGTAFDRALLFEGLDAAYEGGAPQRWLEDLARRLTARGVLLPAELDRIRRCKFYPKLLEQDRMTSLVMDSEQVSKWMARREQEGDRERLELPEKLMLQLDRRRQELVSGALRNKARGQVASIHGETAPLLETTVSALEVIWSIGSIFSRPGAAMHR
jgi:hypothetical protein